MTAFLRLSDVGRAALLSLFVAAIIGLLFLVMIRRIRLRREPAVLRPLLLLLLVGIDLTFLVEAQHALHMPHGAISLAGQWAGSLPFLFHAILLAAAGVYSAWGLWREKRIAQTEITPDSIREALDNLPSGLCFSDMQGIPLLTNRQLYRLAEELTGHLFRNAEELWQELAAFEGRNGIMRLQDGAAPVFCLPDGSIWQLIRAELTIDRERYVQTTAADITQLYTLSRELKRSNAALDEQHKRLNSLLKGISQIKREEEILASKVNIHDALGRSVLAGRRVLAQEQQGAEMAPVLALWRDTVEKLASSLHDDSDEGGRDTLRQLTDAARALGCTIEWEGELPQDQEAAYLLLTAAREAVTNAVRHADADRVRVRLCEQNNVFLAEIKDNGKKRPNAITEGGGLQTLRRRVERAGGGMAIICEDGVRLHLRLPLGGKGE